MNLLNQILANPQPFAAGVVMLLAGPWLLRKSGKLLLVFLAVGVASAAYTSFRVQGWVDGSAMTQVAAYGVAVLAAVVLSRHPIVARNAEFLFVLALCFVVGPALAGWLHWPAAAVWVTLLAGAALLQPMAIAVVAAALISTALQLATWQATSTVFLLCLGGVLVLSCRSSGRFWDPELRRRMGASFLTAAAPSGSSAARPEKTSVLFSCAHPAEQKLLSQWLENHGIEVEQFPGDYAGAEVPTKILDSWRWPWTGLFRPRPDNLISGERQVFAPPLEQASGAEEYMTLAEASRRIRSFEDRSLPDKVATGKGIRFAVLDTGVNPVTPALERALGERVSFAPEDPTLDDHRNHGTAVAAALLAPAPDTKIDSVKVLNSQGHGNLYSVMRGLKYVADHHDRIDGMNLSLGGHSCSGRDTCPLCRGVKVLAEMGVASCAAIGNSGPAPGSVECPGASSGALGVAAVDADGRVASFSSRGPCKNRKIRKPDVASFGVSMQVPGKGGQFTVASGTSFASPLVAGVMSGCLQLMGSRKTRVNEVYETIRKTAMPIPGVGPGHSSVGTGLANLCALAERLGAVRSRSLGTRRVIKPLLARFAAAAAILMAFTALWWLGLDHAGQEYSVEDSSRPVLMLGRVRSAPNVGTEVLFDDGTGAMSFVWAGPTDERPEPGSIIFLRAEARPLPGSGARALYGRSRFTIW